MLARYMRPSVRPSFTGLCSMKMAEHHTTDATVTLVSDAKDFVKFHCGHPKGGGAKYSWDLENLRSSTNTRCILETVWGRDVDSVKVSLNRKSYVFYQTVILNTQSPIFKFYVFFLVFATVALQFWYADCVLMCLCFIVPSQPLAAKR